MSEDINDVVRAKRFELVDDAGQVRAVLSSGPEGRVVLTFMGAENPAIRAALGIGSDGGAFLNLFDDQERVRVNLSVNARGVPLNISLRDAVGRTKTQLSLDQRGGTGIIVTDNWGIRRASLQVSEEGQPALLFFDEDGKVIPGGGIVPPKRD